MGLSGRCSAGDGGAVSVLSHHFRGEVVEVEVDEDWRFEGSVFDGNSDLHPFFAQPTFVSDTGVVFQ